MSFSKPEYIQSFIDEKLSKTKDPETCALLEDHGSGRCEGHNDVSNRNELKQSSRRSSKNRAGSSASPSIISQSGEVDRTRGSSAASKNSRYQHKSLASDADCETSDSGEALQRPRTNCSNGSSPISRKDLNNKSKYSKIPLIVGGESNGSYGGTSNVDLDSADLLASYGSNADKEPRKVGANLSTNGVLCQRNTTNGQANKGKTCNGGKKKDCHNHGYQNEHKHHSDSNEDSDTDFGKRRQSTESDHCHDSSDERSERDEMKRKKAMKKLLFASCLSFLFMVGEIVGGYLANSLAVMTDASHLLTDVSSFMISILALKMASRPVSKKMTFGWHRAEVIGALASVLTIWVVTAVLVYLAIRRLVTNQYEVNGRNMLITSALAVAFNIVMGLVLHEHGHMHGHSHGHSHGHGHDHDHDEESGSNASDDNESGNVNVRAAFIHVLGDLLQSIGVTVAAFIIYFKPEYKIADPICTFLFSILVLITTITILRDTVVIIMEGSPVNIKYNAVKEKLLDIEGITAVHDLRIWSLTLNQTVMSAHLAIDEISDPNTILKRATRRLKGSYNFHSITLQVEYYSDDMDSCKKCQPA